MSLNLDDVQGVEVGDEQVRLPVGCTSGEWKIIQMSNCDAVLLISVFMQHKAVRVTKCIYQRTEADGST